MERVDWVGFSVLAWMRAGGEGSGSEFHEDASVVWDVAFCEF